MAFPFIHEQQPFLPFMKGRRSVPCPNVSSPASWLIPSCLPHYSLWWWSVTSIWAWIEIALSFAKSYAPENVQCSTFNVCSCTLAFPPFWFGVIILCANFLLYIYLIDNYKSSSCLYLCLPLKMLCYLKEVTLAFSLISSHNILFSKTPIKDGVWFPVIVLFIYAKLLMKSVKFSEAFY